MCCFSGRVRQVSATNVYARALDGGWQRIAYGMTAAFDAEVAMVLPLPVAVGSGEHAVRFVDMSGAPKFFDDLDALYPKMVSGSFGRLAPASAGAPVPKLVVHSVGDFEASFVPSVAEFSRLDPRFRLSDDVWRALPEYSDWGFAVFKLKGGASGQKVHPMAFDFPMREPDAIFVPTVHVHDGAVHERATFDHTVYLQAHAGWESIVTSFRAPTPTSTLPPSSRAFVDASSPVYRELYGGELPNQDVWIRGEILRGRVFVGEAFRVRINTAWDLLAGGGRGKPKGPEGLDPQVWKEITTPEAVRRDARDRAGEVFAAAVARRGAAWGIVPFRYDLPAVHPQAYAQGMFAPPAVEDGCVVTVYEPARRVMGINATIAFRTIPSSETMAEIQGVLREAVARVG